MSGPERANRRYGRAATRPAYDRARPADHRAHRAADHRPLCLSDPTDPRGWSIADAYGHYPALWVAPGLEDEAARARRGAAARRLDRDLVGPAGARRVVVEAPLERIPVWVRAGSIVVTYPSWHVARGLGDVAESERPLVATVWGEPRAGRSAVGLADGTRIAWRRGEWSVVPRREISFREVA